MKNYLLFAFTVVLYISAQAQLYFPPNGTSEWETIAPENLNWCPDKIEDLYQFL
ncbi:MAG TPA: serine hydrolase, partial [Flavobacteriaceae bacterium]|nr:serine hydrolase [Flavobacteriaceae bacterium]